MGKANSETDTSQGDAGFTDTKDPVRDGVGSVRKCVNRVNSWIGRLSFPLSVLLLVGYTLFVQFPNLFEVKLDPNDHFWAILEISDSLTIQPEFEPGSHNEKKTLRPTVPGLVRLLNLRSAGGIYVLFCVSNLLWIAFTLGFLRRETDDPALSFWAVALLCGVYVGGCGFLDTMGWGDIVGLTLVAMALYWHRSWILTPLLTLAMLSDERAVLSSGFVLLLVLSDRLVVNHSPFGRWMGVSRVAGAFALFLVVRVYLQLGLGFEGKSGMLGIKAYLSLDPGAVHAGLWSGFELGWWIMFLSLAVCMKRTPQFAILAMAGLMVLLLGSLMVADVTRSLSYGFPWFVISLLILQNEFSHPDRRAYFRYAVLVTAVFCAMIPGPVVFGQHRFQAPLVLRVLPLGLSKVQEWQSGNTGEADSDESPATGDSRAKDR